MFKYVVNYLKQCDVEELYLPDGQNIPMFKENWYYANSFFKSFIKKIVFLYNNTDVLIKEALEARKNIELNTNTSQQNDSNQSKNSQENVTKINKIKK